MTENNLARQIAAVRRFNRFYTQQVGALNAGLLESPFSLTEARVLYELAQQAATTATALGQRLGLDAGYLSRILRDFAKRGLLVKQLSLIDRRQHMLALTPTGEDAFALLDARSHAEIAALLATLPADERRRLAAAMHSIEHLLDARAEPTPPYLLRAHQPGDIGWVVYRHGVLYADEYGWDTRFEALVAEIVAAFIGNFDPQREHCWIAERDGEIIGSVFLVKQDAAVAKLRLLLVEPKARGLGVGRRLVAECVRFARQAGYQKITLWTNSVLVAARSIYADVGFRLVHAEPYQGFGHDLVGETWELLLEQPPTAD